jgi:hypothetical protein
MKVSDLRAAVIAAPRILAPLQAPANEGEPQPCLVDKDDLLDIINCRPDEESAQWIVAERHKDGTISLVPNDEQGV